MFVPAVILCQWIWPILKQRSIWFVLTLVVSGLIVGWLVMGLPGLKADQWTATELGKMFAFRLAAYTDLPLVQLLIASIVGWLRCKRKPVPIAESTESKSQLAAG